MANTIALRKAYSTMLDEVYKLASLTAVLDGPNDLVKRAQTQMKFDSINCLCRDSLTTTSRQAMLLVM